MTAPGSSEEAAAQLGVPTLFWSARLETDENPGVGVWHSSWGVWRALTVGDALGTQAPPDAIALVPDHGGGESAAPPKPEPVEGLRAILVHESLWSTIEPMLRRQGWALGRIGSPEAAAEAYVIIPSTTIEHEDNGG